MAKNRDHGMRTGTAFFRCRRASCLPQHGALQVRRLCWLSNKRSLPTAIANLLKDHPLENDEEEGGTTVVEPAVVQPAEASASSSSSRLWSSTSVKPYKTYAG